VVDRTALEMRHRCKPNRGSNPPSPQKTIRTQKISIANRWNKASETTGGYTGVSATGFRMYHPGEHPLASVGGFGSRIPGETFPLGIVALEIREPRFARRTGTRR